VLVFYGPLVDGNRSAEDADWTMVGSTGAYTGISIAARDIGEGPADDLLIGAPWIGAGSVHLMLGRGL
jgi:hypothetical protein